MLEVIKAFICCLIFMISLYVYGIVLFKNNQDKNYMRIIIIFFIVCILHTIIFLYLDGTSKTIALCLLYSIFIKTIFNQNASTAIISSVIYSLLTIIPDLIITIFAIYIFKMSKIYFYTEFIGGIIGNLLVTLLMILLIYVLRKKLRKIANYNLATKKVILLVTIITIIFVTYFFYEFATAYKYNQNVLVYLISAFAFIIILFTLFKEKIDNDIIVKKYDELLDIMKNYERDIEEQRTLIHETKNEMMTIKSKIKDKENSKDIIEYIDSILGDKISTNMTKYSKFMYLPSNGLKGFFYYKFIEAEKRGINVSVNISQKIEHSFLGKLDTNKFKELVRIIGVYLDNAIEASEKSNKKNLGIEIYVINKNVEIIISNTYLGKIESEKVGEEKYSTKGKNRGHGLLLVKKILSENKIFSEERKITNELYIQKIIIKRKED